MGWLYSSFRRNLTNLRLLAILRLDLYEVTGMIFWTMIFRILEISKIGKGYNPFKSVNPINHGSDSIQVRKHGRKFVILISSFHDLLRYICLNHLIMPTLTSIQKISAQQMLLAKLHKAGGVPANRKALEDLQALFSKEIPKPAVAQLRKTAWRTNWYCLIPTF